MVVGSGWGRFLLFGDAFGIVLGMVSGSFRDIVFGIVLASFWVGFEIVFGSVRNRLGCVRVVFGRACACFVMVLVWFLGPILEGGPVACT